MANILFNNFTSGEICDDAWDRTDMQPVQHGCELGQNLAIRVQGPLGKRRGFWMNGAVLDQTKMGRPIPFRRTVDDAVMLEFGDELARVWQADGSLLMSGDAPVTFATPFAIAQTQTLRWKQIADVIYFFSSDGMRPQALSRISDTDWTFAPLAFTNGPWRPENINTASTVTLTGTDVPDIAVSHTGAGVIEIGQAVTVNASAAIFVAGQVGAFMRLRQNDGSNGVNSWAPATKYTGGQFLLSNNRVYLAGGAGEITSGTTPPVHESGTASDGAIEFTYLHDGAGIVQITGYTSPTAVTAMVTATVPLLSGVATRYWAEGAYSAYRGWPTAWPSMREERLVMGSTFTDQDFVDLTQTAGFTPTTADFTPGTGTGEVIDTNAVRRRNGDDGSPIVWLAASTYLCAGTETGEYIIAGSVLDEPITPAAVIDKKLSLFGVADAAPALAWDSVLYIAAANQNLRELTIDQSQQKATRDVSVLATHIADLGFEEIAWVKQPDNVLWARLASGALATFSYQKEQNVEGWLRQLLPGGFAVEWMAVLPGPSKLDTLWLQVSRQKNGATQRFFWMQSQKSDALFYDGAQYYAGAGVAAVSGLDAFDGEIVGVMANGAEQIATAVVGGAVAVPAGSTDVAAGLQYQCIFDSLRLDFPVPGQTLNQLKRITGANVNVLSAGCYIGQRGYNLEFFNPRTRAQVPAPAAIKGQKPVTFVGDSQRDARIRVTDNTGYDFAIYSIQAQVANNG